MTRRREPSPIAATVYGLVSAIACQSPEPSSRLRQLHEINPGAYHRTHGVDSDTCPHCTDEEAP